MFSSFNIPDYFKPTNTSQGRPKDNVKKGKVIGPVYHIACDDCDCNVCKERSLKTHFLEHQRKNSVGSEGHYMYMWTGRSME